MTHKMIEIDDICLAIGNSRSTVRTSAVLTPEKDATLVSVLISTLT